MARPRLVSDAEVLAAVARTVGRIGPVRLTLAEVAKEAGLSAAALVQRYGGKRELLIAFIAGDDRYSFTARMRLAYERSDDPVEGLIDAVVSVAGEELTPDEFANHLAFLHFELADPEFRRLLAGHDRAVRDELEQYVHDAVVKGRLVVEDELALVEAVNALLSGTQLTWAMSRRGTLRDALRRDLGTLLDPYRS
ncbi:TetR/AcrR family transcriptional regulator [Tenggerimyces flavus]|uniref:TetR family transcriptional regulator n=1 Tax=Tenggerimyces flavus TaxID=1708749 RepID=A0ABV7YR00_9ACTN|nr:TetR/AcrR family transcriptional regulator [Tenggerimyces flavus]MBM7790401.1 AcrR family transcriptional regulator [Tenggerimyces flavus]